MVFHDDRWSGRVTDGWYDTGRQAVEAAREWQKEVSKIEIPDDPTFHDTDSPISPAT